jgi:hypothetical protein
MDAVVPWARLEALIEPHYPKSGKVGRPPIGVPRMLRMYFLQQWHTLANESALNNARTRAVASVAGDCRWCELQD